MLVYIDGLILDYVYNHKYKNNLFIILLLLNCASVHFYLPLDAMRGGGQAGG